jgi:hypothetical protein
MGDNKSKFFSDLKHFSDKNSHEKGKIQQNISEPKHLVKSLLLFYIFGRHFVDKVYLTL